MLKNKVAVVTGANRGIGLATVEVFAENGATIWACARIQSDEFEAKLKEIAKKNSVNIFPIYFDISDSKATKEAINLIGKTSKTIDVLVNNAGISTAAIFNMTSMEMLQKTINVNFFSEINITQLVTRYMMKKKSGSIVNVASVSGVDCEEGSLAYGSSKAAVIFSSKTIALELGKYGIRVNSVSPGFIDTDMWKNRKEDVKEKRMNETPLHRQGNPREVAQAILFFASDMSSFVTGQNLVIDGGRKR